jgi:cytochrome c553
MKSFSFVSLALLALLADVTALASGDSQAGKSKAQSCAVCHGLAGISSQPATPHLAGQPAIYVNEQLQAYRSGKRQNAIMSVIAKPLTDRDIQDLAAWYASIEIQVKQ